MHLDFSTLFWAMGAVTFVAGLLLLFSWQQDRRSTALAYWGAAYTIMALGGLLFAARAYLPQAVTISLGGGIVLFGFGLVWCGARTFEGRTPNIPLAAAGSIIWLVLSTFGAFDYGLYPRVLVATSIIVTYLSLTDRKSTRLNSSHTDISRMPSSA